MHYEEVPPQAKQESTIRGLIQDLEAKVKRLEELLGASAERETHPEGPPTSLDIHFFLEHLRGLNVDLEAMLRRLENVKAILG